MIIQYANGMTMEGVALSRTEDTMRMALRGHNDAIELFQVNGCWITEDWQPVRIQPEPDPDNCLSSASEDEFVCSHELASRLIHLLRPGPAAGQPAANLAVEWSAAAFSYPA